MVQVERLGRLPWWDLDRSRRAWPVEPVTPMAIKAPAEIDRKRDKVRVADPRLDLIGEACGEGGLVPCRGSNTLGAVGQSGRTLLQAKPRPPFSRGLINPQPDGSPGSWSVDLAVH
jgi:hypothetical protein